MPDWSYRTIFKPLLSRIRFSKARALALGSMGFLGRSSIGRCLISWMGHMEPDSRLRTQMAQRKIRSPVMISAELDRELTASEALCLFGAGILEVGPYLWESCIEPSPCQTSIPDDKIDWRTGALHISPSRRCWISDRQRLSGSCLNGTELAARVELPKNLPATEAVDGLICWRQAVSSGCQWMVFDATNVNWSNEEAQVVLASLQSKESDSVACIVRLRWSQWQSWKNVWPVQPTFAACFVLKQGELISPDDWEDQKRCLGKDFAMVHQPSAEPSSAYAWLQRGATVVVIDSLMAVSGPGAIKRIHAAELAKRTALTPQVLAQGNPPHERSTQMIASWVWALLLGCSMLFGGWLTLFLGIRGVLLPYDEVYLGITAEELYARHPQLVRFMAHDRVTLAGTMIAVGICYAALGWFGIRRGMHWSMMTIFVSCMVGFASFFLFLLFGYFDPLHAFVSAVLLQLTFQMLQSPIDRYQPPQRTCLADDLEWKAAQWGQLLLIVQAVGLTIAGLAIAFIGSTQVFVNEDLVFLGMTKESILQIHPRLISVVAHDRAAFGGMLLASGMVVLHIGMWGFERERAWLWWTLMLAGSIGYCTTILVHHGVGYTDGKHLFPAAAGLLELWIALAFSYPYLCTRSQANAACFTD